MEARNIKLTIAYDGSDFQGWQVQEKGRTVQGEVEKALSRMHKEDIRVHCAGRTDAGVHATGQVINFFSNLDSLAPEQFARATSSFLPKDIAVLRAEEVAGDFMPLLGNTTQLYLLSFCLPGAFSALSPL